MYTPTQIENAERMYKRCYHELLNLHMKHPTVLEVVLYMATITGEDTENILKVMEMENENTSSK